MQQQTLAGEHESLECEMIMGDGSLVAGVPIKLPKDLVSKHVNDLRRGEWFVKITGATLEDTFAKGHVKVRTTIFVPKDSVITTVSPERGDQLLISPTGGARRQLRGY